MPDTNLATNISLIDIIVPLLSGVMGVFVGGVINFVIEKKSRRDEFLFNKRAEAYEELLIMLKENFDNFNWLINSNNKGKEKITEAYKELSNSLIKIKRFQAIRFVYFSNEARKILKEYITEVLPYDLENFKKDDIEKISDDIVRLKFEFSKIMKKDLGL